MLYFRTSMTLLSPKQWPIYCCTNSDNGVLEMEVKSFDEFVTHTFAVFLKFRIIFKRAEASYSLRWWDFFLLFVSSSGRNVNAVDSTSWMRKSWRFGLFMTCEKVKTFFVSLGFWVIGNEKHEVNPVRRSMLLAGTFFSTHFLGTGSEKHFGKFSFLLSCHGILFDFCLELVFHSFGTVLRITIFSPFPLFNLARAKSIFKLKVNIDEANA